MAYRYRFGYRRRDARQAAAAVAVALALAAGVGKAHAGARHHHGQPAGSPRAAAAAISYARAQLGKPYCWGGTGPSCYDCSGLTSEAYGLPYSDRTAAEQWANLPHVSRGRPGDLVFAPGADGTWAAPGHVALVITGRRVIQAYAVGTPIEVSSLSSFAANSGGIIGYARPS
jgi:cell wall-associated NlpC family hydrolase